MTCISTPTSTQIWHIVFITSQIDLKHFSPLNLQIEASALQSSTKKNHDNVTAEVNENPNILFKKKIVNQFSNKLKGQKARNVK